MISVVNNSPRDYNYLSSLVKKKIKVFQNYITFWRRSFLLAHLFYIFLNNLVPFQNILY